MSPTPHCHEEATGPPEETELEASPAAEKPVPEATARRRSDRFLGLLAALAITALVVAGAVVGYFLPLPGAERTLPEGATIYFNAACGDCLPYLDEELLPALSEHSIPVAATYDYVNEPERRAALNAITEDLGIPYSLRGHLMTFVKRPDESLLVVSGHVPGMVVHDALTNVSTEKFRRLLVKVSDSEMGMGMVEEYLAWAFTGSPRTLDVEEPLETYLLPLPGSGTGERSSSAGLLPLVLGAGFVDGLNPCAFAVLLFLIAFLFVARRPRTEVLGIGGIYIYAIFAVYFLIGIGLIGAIILSGDPHLMARIGGALLIFLGALTILNAYVPRIPTIKMPAAWWARAKPWLVRGTVPTAAIAGLLVGLCTFPCSGGIYVAVIGLIASRTAYLEGLAYLLLYNVMFVVPLILILAVVANKTLARRLAAWERGNQRTVRALAGLAMIGVAVLVLLMV